MTRSHGAGSSLPRPLQIPVLALCATLFAALPRPLAAQATGIDLDTVHAGRFDGGKMWTFEYPPMAYFTSTYGFNADSAWFAQARLAALRIPGCSASFVSPNGLIATNHHCARGGVTRVSRPGEDLLDNGFYAPSVQEERRVPGFYADQLIAIEDVSDQVFAAVDQATTDAARQEARRQVIERIRQHAEQQYGGTGGQLRVQVIGLYNGGRYSAYVFRRYTDVRLVAAAELQLGFFGGDADNFTYPRHALDFSFLRIYGPDGKPLHTDHYFKWSQQGTKEGDVVFVIGNPGPTNRLNTVAQLEYQRDVQVPVSVHVLQTRLDALQAFYAAHPAEGEAMNLRNSMFGLSNSLKAYTGRQVALKDAVILQRRRDAERQFRDSIQARPALQSRYGGVIDSIAALQKPKLALGPAVGAFAMFGARGRSSVTLQRAVAAAIYLQGQQQGLAADSLATRRRAVARIGDLPADMEAAFLTLRLADFRLYLGADDPLTQLALGGRTPQQAAAALLSGSVLGDSVRTAQALAAGTLSPSDPAIQLVAALLPRYAMLEQQMGRLNSLEDELAADLGRAHFEVYGTSIPPDATSSPRITDGVVKSYAYNGTMAPPHTTFFGMYDLYSAFGKGSEWDLPTRWVPPPSGLDLSTPLDFISTADTYGGNSGSPAVTPQLELVGLNFDRNIEGLSRDFIYLPERGRNIMVDVRAILEALDDVYDADRIVMELTTGRLFNTEQEADAARR